MPSESIKFRPVVRHGTAGPERVLAEICGEAIAYGLVLHPEITVNGRPTSLYGVGISCPITGYRITGGDDRELALRNLDELVRQHGGREPFMRRVAAARTRILAAREAAAARPPIDPVLPAVRATLGIQEATS